MPIRSALFALSALSALFALLAAGCSGPATIVGTVLDEQGSPVAGAEVRTEPETDVRVTNAQGRFLIRDVLDGATARPMSAGRYRVIVAKMPGFETSETDLDVAGTTPVKITLKEKVADIGDPTAPEPVPEDPVDPGRPNTPVSGT